MALQPQKTDAIIEAWSLRFPRAYAEFVRTLSEGASASPSSSASHGMGAKFAMENVFEDEDPKGYRRMAAVTKLFWPA